MFRLKIFLLFVLTTLVAMAQRPLEERLNEIIAASPYAQNMQISALAVDLSTGDTLVARHISWRMRPASTNKVITAVTALDHLGGDYKYCTSLCTSAAVDASGVLQGDLYLRAGFDPLLSETDLRALADGLKAAKVQRVKGNVYFDASMKQGTSKGEGWCWDDKDVPLNPLQLNGRPSGLEAAVRKALQDAGITVRGKVGGKAQAPRAAKPLASFQRAVDDVLRPMMKESNNNCAESLFYQFCSTAKQGAVRVQETLERAGYADRALVNTADGSGLSLYNYATTSALVSLLTYAKNHSKIYSHLYPSLPIAGRDGTLRSRMTHGKATGNVHAKTGTLTSVSSLAGYCTSAANHPIVFAIICNGQVKAGAARDVQDAFCEAMCCYSEE